MEDNKKEKVKKLVVIGFLILLFCGIIYMILKPNWEKQDESTQSGINDFPSASTDGLPSSKMDSYNGSMDFESSQEATEMAYDRLNDYAVNGDTNILNEAEPAISREEEELNKALQAYHDASLASQQYSQYYDESDSQLYQMELDLDRAEQEKAKLEMELAAYKNEEAREQRQMALLEKSYELANRYNAQQNPQPAAPPEPKRGDQNLANISVVKERKHTVTTLLQHEQDSILIARLIDEPSNTSFYTPVGAVIEDAFFKNTIKAVVSETQIVKSGDNVKLQLLESIRLANGLLVPKNTKLIARATLSGNRMKLVVQSLEIDGALAGVQLSAYDTAGQEGIFVPDAPVSDAVVNFSTGLANTLGTSSSVNINNTTAVEQLKGDVIRGAVRGVADLVKGAVETYKVKLNSGYRLLLYDTTRKN